MDKARVGKSQQRSALVAPLRLAILLHDGGLEECQEALRRLWIAPARSVKQSGERGKKLLGTLF